MQLFFRNLWIITAIILFTIPHVSYAAELSLSPASGSFDVGKEFSVKALVKPGTDSINAADGSLSFDKDLLSISSFSKDGSAFSLWTAEPSFSNSAGTFSFSGGTPTAFSTSGTVLTIKFKAKKSGTAQVSFTKGSILAADGKGTDVYTKGGNASFTLSDSGSADAVPADTSSASADTASGSDGGPPPLAPTIDSPTYPRADNWYATSTAMFTWKLQQDVIGVRTLWSDKDDATPSKIQKPDATSTVVTGIKDGTSYFYVQYKNDSGWGEIGKRKVLVDTAPPSAFEVSLVDAPAGGVAKLAFKTDDALSGMDRYEIVLGTSVVASVSAKDVTDGSYPVPPQDGGPQTVSIRAYDMAGNMREAKSDLTLPKVAAPTKKSATDAAAVPPQPFWTMDRILMIFFAFVIGGLISWIYYSRKTIEENHLRILKRVSELADKNDRIFSAMREEFEQMIHELDDKPQLTPAERKFIEDMKEVLDVSEELVDTGIGELKKEIRGQ